MMTMTNFTLKNEPVPFWYRWANKLDQDLFPIETYLYMDDGKEATFEDIRTAFKTLTGVGYRVIRSYKHESTEVIPNVGVVTEIDDEFVYIENNDSYIIQRDVFHKLYRPVLW